MWRGNGDAVGGLPVGMGESVRLVYRQIARFFFTKKVGTASGVYEKGVATKYAPRNLGMLSIGEDIGDMLGSVSRRVPRGDDDRSETKSIAIVDRFRFESILRVAFVAHIDAGRFHPGAQFARAAHQIGVDVRLG